MLEMIPLPVFLSFSKVTVVFVAVTSSIGVHSIVPVTILPTSAEPAAVHIRSISFAVLLLGS
ncbi:hypothetical protein [Brevibacillus laterosporus]|uniref:hypothetical protein n=1 Tax=Brevibacillus laterosporus TaxID=1465 RepID=UPI003D1E2EEC